MIDKVKYIHHLEEETFNEMISTVSLNDELEKNFSLFEEKIKKPDLLGKTLKVTQNQLGEIYYIAEKICNKLDMKVPDIYVYEDFYYGVESRGTNNPWLEISAKTIEDFFEEEITFLIARELCSIKLKHTYYQTLIDEYISMMDNVKFIVGADEVSKINKAIMCRWSRIANFTEDNFGLYICKNISICSKVVLKLILNNTYLAENVNMLEYIKQTEEINKLNDDIYNYTKLDERIPYGPYRIKNLLSYSSSSRFIKDYSEGLMEE